MFHIIPKFLFLIQLTIPLKSHHKDLGIAVSDDLQWHLHHNYILDKSYKILGMIRRAFGKSN